MTQPDPIKLLDERIAKLKADHEALRVRLQADLNEQLNRLRDRMLDALMPHEAAIAELSAVRAALLEPKDEVVYPPDTVAELVVPVQQ